jgi:hypothetical protein
MPILDKLLSGYSSAIQLPDDYTGRLPLHWACIAGASPVVLQKLVGLHPPACKTTDKLYGRLPLHYMAMHASTLTQVSVVLESETRAINCKDKSSKTPLDLAQESSNPLKFDILSLLQKRRTNNTKRHSASKSGGKEEEAKHQRGAIVYDEWETPLNVKVNKPPAPEHPQQEYQVPDYSYGGGAKNVMSTDYKLRVHVQPPPPMFRNSAKGTAPANSKGIPKAPNTGGIFMDRAMLLTNMERPDLGNVSVVEDPGPRTNTDLELPPPPDMDRSETWAGEPPDDYGNRRSLQDKLMKNAFDFSNDSIPLDPLGQSALAGKSKHQQRRPSAKIVAQSPNVHAVPPTHRTRKLKPPPPNSIPQQQPQQQQQQQHDPRRGHQMTPVSSRPKRPSDPITSVPPISSAQEYNQTKRRSEPISDSEDVSQGRVPTKKERQYFQRHVEKMDVYAQQPGMSHTQQPGASHERGPPPRSDKEEDVKGWDLVSGLNSTIRGLSETIASRERDFKEKESQLATLDLHISQMKKAEVELAKDLDVAKATARQNQDAAHQKHTRISDLTQRIQQLQAELRAEESDVQSIARNIPIYLENAVHAESKLKGHRDEQGSLGAVRQALDDEKACIVRDLDNSTSELKSLEAIQNLAMGGDDL